MKNERRQYFQRWESIKLKGSFYSINIQTKQHNNEEEYQVLPHKVMKTNDENLDEEFMQQI